MHGKTLKGRSVHKLKGDKRGLKLYMHNLYALIRPFNVFGMVRGLKRTNSSEPHGVTCRPITKTPQAWATASKIVGVHSE